MTIFIEPSVKIRQLRKLVRHSQYYMFLSIFYVYDIAKCVIIYYFYYSKFYHFILVLFYLLKIIIILVRQLYLNTNLLYNKLIH